MPVENKSGDLRYGGHRVIDVVSSRDGSTAPSCAETQYVPSSASAKAQYLFPNCGTGCSFKLNQFSCAGSGQLSDLTRLSEISAP